MSDFGDPADYALTGYLRFWQVDDSHLARRVQEEGLEEAAVDIRSAYGFGINLASKLMPQLAEAVMHFAWPEDMLDRAKACICVANEFGRDNSVDRPFSAVTKLAWFAKPEGWVPFDRLVAEGLGARGAPTEKRLADYYEKLADHLPALSAKIQPALERLHCCIRPERIVDRYLWLRGMGEDRQRTEFNRLDSFLEAQIPAAREVIKDARKDVAEILRASDLVKSLDKKKA